MLHADRQSGPADESDSGTSRHVADNSQDGYQELNSQTQRLLRGTCNTCTWTMLHCSLHSHTQNMAFLVSDQQYHLRSIGTTPLVISEHHSACCGADSAKRDTLGQGQNISRLPLTGILGKISQRKDAIAMRYVPRHTLSSRS